jgi:hypothetical protein
MDSRITKIVLSGYKGLTRTYQLGDATLLTGVNGTGKSACIEGVVYALSGRVPLGKSLDAVAQYFPARGGWVEIHDEAGRWIKRGISRDHERKKVSETLEVSGTPEGRDPDLAPWYCSETVLNLAEFLGLSSEKRREFALKLCGASAADTTTLIGELADEYAREIAGEVATAAVMEETELTGDPATLWEAWNGRRGLREVVSSHMIAGKSITETCLKLGDVAKQERLSAGRAAKDAQSAIRELEAEAKGARAAADEIATRKAEVEALRHDLGKAREKAAAAVEAQRAFGLAAKALEKASGDLYKAKNVVDGLPPLGERPVPPEGDPRREEAFRRAGEAQVELTEIGKRLASFGEDVRALTRAEEEQRIAGDELETHRASKLGRVVGLVGEIPDEADPGMPELRAAVDDLSAEWQARTKKLEAGVEATAKAWETADSKRDDWEADEREILTAETTAREKVWAQSAVLSELEKAQSGSTIAHRNASAAWETAQRTRQDAEMAVTRLDVAWQKASVSEASAKARLGDVATLPTAAADIEVKLDMAQAALETAEKAAGAVAAYKTAISHAERNKVLEAAWKACEAALKTVREKLVGAATEPLVSVLNEVLAAAGRPERAYLELENERGRPIFELGWVRNSERIALPALSTGESAVFCAALSLAITMRSDGRKVLLCDATTVTEDNRGPFLATLAPWAERLDALVVEVAAMTPPEVSDAWTVIELQAASGKEVSASAA